MACLNHGTGGKFNTYRPDPDSRDVHMSALGNCKYVRLLGEKQTRYIPQGISE